MIHDITDYGAPGTEFLGMVPVEDGGLSWVMPLLAGLSAVAMGFAQNRINPLQREQSKMEKNTTNGLSIVLSLVLGVYVAAGMAFYWICSESDGDRRAGAVQPDHSPRQAHRLR